MRSPRPTWRPSMTPAAPRSDPLAQCPLVGLLSISLPPLLRAPPATAVLALSCAPNPAPRCRRPCRLGRCPTCGSPRSRGWGRASATCTCSGEEATAVACSAAVQPHQGLILSRRPFRCSPPAPAPNPAGSERLEFGTWSLSGRPVPSEGSPLSVDRHLEVEVVGRDDYYYCDGGTEVREIRRMRRRAALLGDHCDPPLAPPLAPLNHGFSAPAPTASATAASAPAVAAAAPRGLAFCQLVASVPVHLRAQPHGVQGPDEPLGRRRLQGRHSGPLSRRGAPRLRLHRRAP